MSKTWVYSDPHFYHQKICTFMNGEQKLRPWDDADKMTEDMIRWYNELVSDADRVYILGDVAFTANNMRMAISRMNGRKVLVPGNHEPTKMRKYFDLFDDVRGYVVKKGFIMSHIPLHPESLSRWSLNIHGHTHANKVMVTRTKMMHGTMTGVVTEPDERYFSACVEQTNFRPIDLDVILKQRGLK